MSRVAWALCSVLALTALAQVRVLTQSGTGFSTMPVFVPLSLEHEAAARRGPALDLAQAEALLAQHAGRPEVARATETHARILALCQERHTLNVALMEGAVDVAGHLSPDQWDRIVGERDLRKAEADAGLLDTVRDGLQ